MNFLLDTCVLSDFFKKNPKVIERFETLSPNQIHISTITIMEIEYGLKLNSERAVKIRPLWDSLLQEIQIAPLCQECAVAAAKIRARLKNLGLPIGPYDILIASTAEVHSLILVSSNLKEFKRIPGIALEDWRL